MVKKKLIICALALLLCQSLFGQSESPAFFSLTLTPNLSVPLGEDATLFTIGLGGDITAAYGMPFYPPLFACANVGYSLVPLQYVTSLSLLNFGLGAGLRYDIGSLVLKVLGTGGYFYASMDDGTEDGTGGNPFATAGASISWAFNPSFSIGLGAAYRDFFGLYNDVSVLLGASYSIEIGAGRATKPAAKKKPLPVKTEPLKESPKTTEPQKAAAAGLQISNVEFFNVFPVFFKYYSDHALGRIVVKNADANAASDVKASFFIKQYMDNPSYSTALASLAPGEEKSIDLYGLLKSNILEISEPTLLSANISVEYTVGGTTRKAEVTKNVRVQDRNALTWEDDRGAAAFVTAKDPTVLKFTKNISAAFSGKASKAVNQKILAAIGIHESLRAYGVTYVVDPARPFDKMHESKDTIDFLQFPAQTLDYRAGDCDDLSILYCALLASQNVATAFITVPGHIFMAFSLDMKPEEARKAFLRPDDLIYAGDATWVPIEVTERQGDFLKAWETGAKEWRESQARGLGKLYPLNDCWQTFEAVGYASSVISLSMPSEEALVKAYTAEVNTFVNREIYPQVATLQAEIQKSKNPSNPTNRLGILYARYGQFDLAEQQFTKLADKGYVPAMVNMGGLCYQRGDLRKALGYYQRAQDKEPKNAMALLGIARASHDMENYGEVRAAYDELKKLDPALAGQFAYLDLRGDEATRAADLSGAKGVMLWEEGK